MRRRAPLPRLYCRPRDIASARASARAAPQRSPGVTSRSPRLRLPSLLPAKSRLEPLDYPSLCFVLVRVHRVRGFLGQTFVVPPRTVFRTTPQQVGHRRVRARALTTLYVHVYLGTHVSRQHRSQYRVGLQLSIQDGFGSGEPRVRRRPLPPAEPVPLQDFSTVE